MKRPLCMVCLIFVSAMLMLLSLFPIPLYEDEEKDGTFVERTGQVYKKEYKNGTLVLFVEGETDCFLCYIKEGSPPKLGSYINVRGSYESFQPSTNPGQFHQKRYYQILNLDYSLKNAVIIKETKEYDMIKESLYGLKNKWAEGYDKALPEKEAGIIKAMVLGDKSRLDGDIKNLYKQSGISHVLAISGLHISLMGMGIFKLLKKVEIPLIPTAIVSIAVVVFYGMLIDGGTSSFRAIFMFFLYLTAKIIGRTYDMLTAMSLAAVILLMEQPLYLYHAGFLLSFSAVMGIGLLYPVLEDMLPEKYRKNPVIKNFLGSVSVSFFSLPILTYYFYEFPVYSLLLNLLIIPLMSILLPVSVLGGLIAVFAPVMGRVLLFPCRWILMLYEALCDTISNLPCHSFITGQPKPWQMGVFYGILFIIIAFHKRKSRKKKMTIMLFAVSAFILCFRIQNNTEIIMLDVGQGDSIFVREEGGNTFLMDGGSSDVSKVGTYRILPFLKSQGVREITYAFVTHPDSDHYNGILECLEQSRESGIFIRYLAVSHLAFKKQNEAYEKLFMAAKKAGTKVVCISDGDMLKYNKITLTCLYPQKDSMPDDSNGESLIFLMEVGEVKMLFTADAGIEEEQQIISKLPKIHILKTGHHGSDSSTGTELLQAAAPDTAIISCGKDNSYGHPGKETLKRLADANTRVYVTAEAGAIKITIKEKGYKIESFGR